MPSGATTTIARPGRSRLVVCGVRCVACVCVWRGERGGALGEGGDRTRGEGENERAETSWGEGDRGDGAKPLHARTHACSLLLPIPTVRPRTRMAKDKQVSLHPPSPFTFPQKNRPPAIQPCTFCIVSLIGFFVTSRTKRNKLELAKVLCTRCREGGWVGALLVRCKGRYGVASFLRGWQIFSQKI